MFDFSASVFKQPISIPNSAKIIFVSDLFVEDYVGGAELTSEALIKACSLGEVFKLHSRDVTGNLISQGSDKFWIFGNFTQVQPQLVSIVTKTLKYSILEYDYKYCIHRSPEKHQSITKTPCDCHNQRHGKMISEFYLGAKALWWMSEAQMKIYQKLFPALKKKRNEILSSVFAPATLDLIKKLRLENKPRSGWIVLGSDSWIKGFDQAKKWCEDNGRQYEVVWNLPYEATLWRLALAEGVVYLPLGGDTCPRLCTEARLLGCQLVVNDNVQNIDESWFS